MRALLALCCAALTAGCFAAAAYAHEGNPNYRSTVRGVEPSTPGVEARVLNFDDRLELVNRSDRTVTVLGYDREPYARIAADGSVTVNRRSPAAYLNEDRFAGVRLPAAADPKADPVWRRVDGTGRFEWHDHRAHWMSKTRPGKVRDPERRTKVFDWKVPIAVGGRRGALSGDLFWVPPPSESLSAGPIIGLAALALLGTVGVVILRRRRRRAGTATGGKEAW